MKTISTMFTWTHDEVGTPLQKLFSSLPLLRVVDSTLIHSCLAFGGANGDSGRDLRNRHIKETSSGVVAPRVFSDCWYMTPSIHRSMRYNPPLLPAAPLRTGSGTKEVRDHVFGIQRNGHSSFHATSACVSCYPGSGPRNHHRSQTS